MVMYDCISKYHPVIHTLFLGGLVKLSSVIFENYSIGNFLYALLQAIFMDFVFSYLITFLKKENAPKWLTILSTLLFMFLPIHSVLAISTTKDVIFSGLVLLLVIKMYNVSNENKYLNSKKNIISIIILIILTLMFRNNMLYALIAFIIPCLLILKKQRKKLILIFGVSILIYSIYDIGLTKIFKIENGPRVEAFSVIIQQYARVYNKENLTDEESSKIEKLFKNNALENYNSQIADPVKSEFNSEEMFSNTKDYINEYFKLGIKYPLTYIDSFLINNYGYFYFFDKIPVKSTKTYIWVSCMNEKEGYACKDKCNNNFIYKLYDNLLEKATFQKVPIINIFMNIGFNVFILFYSIMFLFYKKNYKESVPLYLLLSLFTTVLLGPVSLVRYVYPIFVCFPFMLFIIIKNCRKK